MTYFIWLLRIVHIFAGIIWVGGALTMTFFIAPTIGAIGDAGPKFTGYLMNNMKFSARLSAAAGLSILAGFILYWIDSAGFTSPWMRSGAGIGFSIGAAFALIGMFFGILMGRTLKALGGLAAQIQGKPTHEQAASLDMLRKRQGLVSKLNAFSLIVSVIFMAIARYLVF